MTVHFPVFLLNHRAILPDDMQPKGILVNWYVTGKKSKKNAPQLSQLTYNLPGNACIQVNYKNRSLTERTVPVAQLGADVPLSKDLFSGNDLPVIVFSEKTGNIVSISK